MCLNFYSLEAAVAKSVGFVVCCVCGGFCVWFFFVVFFFFLRLCPSCHERCYIHAVCRHVVFLYP